ncbi:MAG: hypothetical protein JO311_08320, partial [Candidatus Eremiobacteraeota bacterium]|nr:hypothetical protein [Candidatus Eremiobacteraeota bacterium]MBV9264259.1 hypothetical protein [Candidatus Eremiobacteraeota bacterium]
MPWRVPGWRIAGFVALVLVALIAIVVRLIVVSILHGDRYRAAAQENQIRLIPVAAPRGVIYDRHGTVMARSRPSFVVALIPSEIGDPVNELKTLGGILGGSPAVLWYRLLHHRGVNYQTFADVVRNEPYGPVILERELPVASVARLSERLADLPGVDLEVQPVRDYPHGSLASHLIGYVGAITQEEYERLKYRGYSPNDVIGKDGLEYSYDPYLRGQPGGQRVVVDATGAVVPSIKLPARPPIAGDTLVTNIDWRLQEITEGA